MSEFLPPPPSGTSAPPGYVPYGAIGSPGWPMAGRTQPLRGLALALSILLPLTAVLALALAAAHLHRAALVEDTFRGEAFDFDFERIDDLDDADSRVDGLTGGYLLMVIATGCVFIVWQYRHAVNAQTLGVRGGLGPPWAIAGWFVPLGSFVLPGLQLHQSSRASDPEPPPGRPGRGRPIVIAWMVAWALAGILTFVGSVQEPSPDDFVFDDFDALVDAQASSDRTSAVGTLLAVVAGGLAVVMVRQLSLLQTQAIDRHPASAPPPPPGPPLPPPPAAPLAAWAPAPPPPPRGPGDFQAPS